MDAEESTADHALKDPVERSLDIDSIAIRRMIEEVRSGDPIVTETYNRTHNRHNR